jgi:hypothetical protein
MDHASSRQQFAMMKIWFRTLAARTARDHQCADAEKHSSIILADGLGKANRVAVV